MLRGFPGALWLILLGWFGLGAARSQSQMLQVQRALRDLKVKDVARRRFRVLEASTSLRRLSELMAPPRKAEQRNEGETLSEGAQPGGASEATENGGIAPGEGLPEWILVCDRGRWKGVIDDLPLHGLPVQRWDGERVGDHLRPLESLPSIAESAPLWQAALQLEEAGSPRLLVIGPAGLPSGTVERPELGEAVLQRLGLRLPPRVLSSARKLGTYPLGMALGQVARSMVASGDVTPATGSTAR
ncbi:MAG: site-2 protease family protein, partial [Synechococcaceae cyanobacterium]|nr:site-2 protease family protein [Synechococcaceae cyanobacterium]